MEARLKACALESRFLMESASATEDIADQENYDIKWYDIHIRVFESEHAVSGRVTFLASATVDGVSAVIVDLASAVSVDSIVAATGATSYTRSGDQVTVDLDRSYAAGEVIEFDFYYHSDELRDPI